MDLGVAEDLDTVAREVIEIPAQSKARTIDVGREYRSSNPLEPTHHFEFEIGSHRVEQARHRDTALPVHGKIEGIHQVPLRLGRSLRIRVSTRCPDCFSERFGLELLLN